MPKRLLTLNHGKLPWPAIDPKANPWIERRIGLTLAESQKAAVAMALGSKVLVITGGPGVGNGDRAQLRLHPRLALGEFEPERDWIEAPALCDFVEGLSAAKAL